MLKFIKKNKFKKLKIKMVWILLFFYVLTDILKYLSTHIYFIDDNNEVKIVNENE